MVVPVGYYIGLKNRMTVSAIMTLGLMVLLAPGLDIALYQNVFGTSHSMLVYVGACLIEFFMISAAILVGLHSEEVR